MISIFRIAHRNLLRKKTRSLLTVVGIALAAWVLANLLGFNRGYEAWLNFDIDNLGFQMLVTAWGSPYEAATLMLKGGTGLRYMRQALADSIAREPEVDMVTPMLMQAVIDPNNGESGGVTTFLGVDAATFPAMKSVLQFKQGQWFADNNALEAVFGYEAAELEQREVGDIYLIPERDVEVKVAGVLERSGAQDDGTIFLPIGTTQRIFEHPNKISVIGIRAKRDADISRFEERIRRLPDVQVVSLAQAKRTAMSLVSTARVMIFSIALIAVLTAVIGVANTVLMSVMERSQEFSILKSMGARTWDIFGLVWLETLALCLSGGLAGTALALASSKMTEVLARKILPDSPTGDLVRIDMPLMLLILAVVTAVGLVSVIYPLWRAGRVRPLRAIRSQADRGQQP